MQRVAEPALTLDLIAARHAALVARLRAAAENAGRDPEGFRVVAVTKGFGAEAVALALAAGLQRFGENRVQEALPKIAAVPKAEWHLVGHLQSNKARPAAGAFAVIHSVDSLALLDRLEALAASDDVRPSLLLQVNVTGESTKAGFAADVVEGQRDLVARAVRAATAAPVVGFMTIGRAGATEAEARRGFAALRRLRDAIQELAGVPLPELSMGMTADAEAAVAEGATLVRIGTGLFGPRPT